MHRDINNPDRYYPWTGALYPGDGHLARLVTCFGPGRAGTVATLPYAGGGLAYAFTFPPPVLGQPRAAEGTKRGRGKWELEEYPSLTSRPVRKGC